MDKKLGDIPTDESARLIYLSHVFGRLLFYMARTPAMDRVSKLPEDVQPEVEEIVDHTLDAVMDLVDGVIPVVRNERVTLELALIARLRDFDEASAVVDEVELAPHGEGLGMGYWMWRDGDFGTTPEW